MITWHRAYWVLLAIWAGCALLGMAHIQAGLLTSYGADLTQPAWLYIVARSLDNPLRTGWIRRTIGNSPEAAAIGIFLAASLTELTQLFWPHGPFPGVYDPRDIVAYGVGLSLCYVVERRQLLPRRTIMRVD